MIDQCARASAPNAAAAGKGAAPSQRRSCWPDRAPCSILCAAMLRRSLAAVALAALIAGCGASHPTAPVTAVVDLERAPSGAPDGGRPGGHRGGGLEATTERSMLAFHGRVRPPVAQLVVRGARASVTVSPSGAFLVWLRGVRPGTERITGAPRRVPDRARGSRPA